MTLPSKVMIYNAEFNAKGKTLSPYSTRLMFLLNYKKIVYETIGIQLPAFEASAKAVDTFPTRTKVGEYDYNDFCSIAKFIEKAYPDAEGKLIPSSMGVQSMFRQYLTNAFAVHASPESNQE
ncbi:hypothetical protein ACEPAG_7260 [Sanghuangporus baumii]